MPEHERQWFYIDSQTNVQRGPVPTAVVKRLLQKGFGITASTLIWKTDMTEWIPIGEVSFADSFLLSIFLFEI
jgi:hypothetical protein